MLISGEFQSERVAEGESFQATILLEHKQFKIL